MQPDIDPAHANGTVSVDEQAQWAERVGWAPRFGQGSITEAEAGESLLDHQTFLETKLDDNWFGGEFYLSMTHYFEGVLSLYFR